MNIKKIGYLIIGLLFFSNMIFMFDFNSANSTNFSNISILTEDDEFEDNFKLRLSDSSLLEFSGVGQAQNVSESGSGNFQNYDLEINNNDKASILVPNYWKANEIICNISNIFEYDKYWINDTFDMGYDSDFWRNYTNSDSVSFGWYNAPTGSNDSIYMRFDETGNPWTGKSAFWNYTLLIPKEHLPFGQWEIIYKYRVICTDYTWLPGASAYHSLFIDVDGSSQEFSQNKLDTLVNNTWYSGNVPLFQPELYGWSLPGNITLRFEIGFKNSIINPTGFLKVFYDNITLKLSTIPKPSQINLTINDLTNGFNTSINDLDEFGLGTVKLNNSWNGDVGGKFHYFSFSHNSTGNLVIYSDFYVKATSSRKTTSQFLIEGSEFLAQNSSKTQWTMYFTVTQPGSYSNDYYFNISKPLNWNITEVMDPYLNNKINDTIGVGYGNTTLIIPNDIITNGLWKFVAEAPNYVKRVDIFKNNGVDWIQNSTFQINDKLKINTSVDTELIPDITGTKGSLQIFYPNGTLFYDENSSAGSDAIIEFSEIIFGVKNASAGNYTIYVKWCNQEDNISQVGLYVSNFVVVHQTELTANNPYFELYAGDPLLIRVKYMDLDLNTSIPFATVTYKSSFGASGAMIYQGSGTYFAEIVTNALGIGDYYFSFNATQNFYQPQITIDLIHLKIIAQPLALEVPKNAISGIGNDNIICQINVTGVFSGSLIWPANVSTDWDNPYSVINHYNGTFTLNFSTSNIPRKGIIETFTVTILVNKTHYGDTSGFITIIVNPIETVVIVDHTIINADLNTIVDIKVNYTELVSGSLINGANCSVDWIGSSNVTSDGDGFIISINTATLSIDSHTAIIKLEKMGFETNYKAITVVINRFRMEINTIGFQNSTNAYPGETITIRIIVTEPGTDNYIVNASVYYSWRFGLGYFEAVEDGIYELELKLPSSIDGSYSMSLIVSKEDSIYQPTDFSFIIVISPITPPNYVPWYIIIGLILGLSIFGILSLRAYVIIPVKRRKKAELLAKTQRFKDAWNVQGLVISQRNSGLALYTKSYYALDSDKKDLLSGFIYAITTISQEFMKKEDVEELTGDQEKIEVFEKVIELDFQYFNFLICDYKSFRAVFILKEQASERLKKCAMNILINLDPQLTHLVDKWDGNLECFGDIIPNTINNCCQLYYREHFMLNKPKYINKVIAEKELSSMESRVINVIKSMTQRASEFYLNEVVEMVDEKNKDLVIRGIESAIEKNLIISTPENN